MFLLLLAGIAFCVVLLTAGAALALCPSRSSSAVWFCVGIPSLLVLIGGAVAAIAGFRDTHSGSSYINLKLRLIVMACVAIGVVAAAALLLIRRK
jgi:hypothetical protein